MTDQELMPVMQLLGWCKNISLTCTQAFPTIFRPPVMQTLLRERLIKPYHDIYGWRLRPSGYRWLAAHGFPALPDQHTQRPGRRFESAAAVVTMYAAGINPFCDSQTQLRKDGGYLSASTLRAQQGQYVLGSNQIMGLLRLGCTLFSVHYPQPAQLVSPQRELDCLNGMTLGAACAQNGFLFCGEDYGSIHRELTTVPDRAAGRRRKKTTYAMFYETVSLNRRLLSCNSTGVMQLRAMRIPHYRQKLAAMIGGETSLPECDFFGIKARAPGRIIVDMELQGIERAARQAKTAGYSQLILAGFEQQIKFLRRIFPPPFFGYIEIPASAIDLMTGGVAYAKTV